MKKVFAIALTLLMVASLLAACGSSSAPETTAAPAVTEAATEAPATEAPATEAATEAPALKTVTPGKLVMSTNAAFPPYEMTTDDGGFAGIDVEVAGKIAEKLGLELVVDDMDFDAALLAVQQGKSDIVMAGVTVTDDRKLVMDFTDSYATSKQVVIVVEGSDVTLDNLADGKLIGTQRGTTGNTMAGWEYGDDAVLAYDNGATACQALKNGQCDCVIIDAAPAAAFVEANPGLVILDTPFAEESYAIGMNKDNADLYEAVNNALNELIADGTVKSISDKFLAN